MCYTLYMFRCTCFLPVQTLSVLNPLQRADERITNDTDLAGPLIFCLLFGLVLLLVCVCVKNAYTCRGLLQLLLVSLNQAAKLDN